MQRLTMPFARQMMQVGYKVPGYRAHWKYDHYGVDLSAHYAGADRSVIASGDGTVVLAGRDSGVGNVVVVLYQDVFCRADGVVRDLAARYMHLASVAVKAGQKIRQGDLLGVEGNTGTADLHLHLELDSDVRYPAHSPQVKGGTLIKKGVDSTLNPSEVLYLGAGQTLAPPTYNPAWLGACDRVIPGVEGGETTPGELGELRRKAAVYDQITALVK